MSAAILQLLNSATSTEMWVLEMYEEVCFGVILFNCFEMNSGLLLGSNYDSFNSRTLQ